MPDNAGLRLPETRCGDYPIRYRAVCSHCEGEKLDMLERIKSYRSYDAGQPIAHAG